MVTAKIRGNQGENLVSQLLKAQGWEILATQWYCRWGELDIVACDRQWLIFVEVKTRSLGNWDEDGALAITKSKQKKLYMSALAFLEQHPHMSNLDCRFDVALVTPDRSGIYQLYTYIESAFSAEEL